VTAPVGGRFVTIEGGEGAGKSTQARRLAERLRARGLEVVETREPGGSLGAEAIRELLLSGPVDWSPEAEALLFAAARADHVERTIRPALKRNAWVVCDRFIDSSSAYQGAAGSIGSEAVRRLHQIGSKGLMPDRTLLLQLSHDEAAARAGARDIEGADRIGARGADYHSKVAAAFARIAAEEPGRFRTVDASGSADEVTARLFAAVEDLL
jgi:dTMP kinase